MGRRVFLILTPAVLLSVAVMVLATATASAYTTNTYCGRIVNEHSWCSDNTYRSYVDNKARYYGSPAIKVGVKFSQESGGTGVCRAFAYSVVSISGCASYGYPARVNNGSNFRHTIWGYAGYQ